MFSATDVNQSAAANHRVERLRSTERTRPSTKKEATPCQ